MRLWHEFCRCKHCGEELEVLDEDLERGFIKCYLCGWENDLTDEALGTWTEDY